MGLNFILIICCLHRPNDVCPISGTSLLWSSPFLHPENSKANLKANKWNLKITCDESFSHIWCTNLGKRSFWRLIVKCQGQNIFIDIHNFLREWAWGWISTRELCEACSQETLCQKKQLNVFEISCHCVNRRTQKNSASFVEVSMNINDGSLLAPTGALIVTVVYYI